jgi:Flp pilus assembly secretin CpaC
MSRATHHHFAPRQAATLSAIKAACIATAVLTAALVLEASKATADDLIVHYDQAQLLRMPRPVAEVIVGNPSIADVTIQGGNLLVVTGKTFGVTNVIALDSDRNVIQDQRIIVERDLQGVVNLHKGTARYTLACAPNCQTTFTIGDDGGHFEMIKKQNEDKTKFSEKGTEAEKGSN